MRDEDWRKSQQRQFLLQACARGSARRLNRAPGSSISTDQQLGASGFDFAPMQPQAVRFDFLNRRDLGRSRCRVRMDASLAWKEHRRWRQEALDAELEGRLGPT